MLAPFRIYVADDGKTLVKEGDSTAATLLVAKGLKITEAMQGHYDFATILAPESKANIIVPPADPVTQGESDPYDVPPKSAEPPKGRGKQSTA